MFKAHRLVALRQVIARWKVNGKRSSAASAFGHRSLPIALRAAGQS
jgi:hypothetical protein